MVYEIDTTYTINIADIGRLRELDKSKRDDEFEGEIVELLPLKGKRFKKENALFLSKKLDENETPIEWNEKTPKNIFKTFYDDVGIVLIPVPIGESDQVIELLRALQK